MHSQEATSLFSGTSHRIYHHGSIEKVLHSLAAVERLIAWAIELNEFDINYISQKAIKTQMVAKVLVNFAEGKVLEPELELWGKLYNMILEEGYWQLHVDRSSTRAGSEAGVVIETPSGWKDNVY